MFVPEVSDISNERFTKIKKTSISSPYDRRCQPKDMGRKSILALGIVSALLIMTFSISVFTNTNQDITENDFVVEMSKSDLVNESQGEVLTVTVDGTNLRFTPDTITLQEGDTVRFFWENQLLPHNAVEENGLFDSGEPQRNVEYNYTFQLGENGTYQYVCEPHEPVGMIGTIIVEPQEIVEPEPEPEVEEEESEALSVGDGVISAVLFTPWFIGMFILVGFITLKRERFQLGLAFEDDSVEVSNEVSTSDGNSLVDNYRARVLTLCALYVAQGIPWGFMTVTFVTYLAVEGVSAGELAFLLTLGTLPWSLKFLWGPIIDRFQYRQMGKRRPWILIAQTGMIIVLASILLIPNPANELTLIASMFLVYNIFTSLQDVSTDALAVDILKPHELEKVNSYMFTAKSVGGVIGGAGLGTIIGFVGIKGAILLQVPILLLIMMVPLFMTERPGEKLFPWSEDGNIWVVDEIEEKKDFKEILSKVKTAFSLRSTQLGIVLSLVMSISAFLIAVLPELFLRELDWSQEKFNATKGGIILGVSMLGYIVGGQLGNRFGGKSIIIYSALGTALFTATWGLTESRWEDGYFMMTIWCLRTFAWSMVSINIFSLMMRITWSEVGGTQFTGYMAMMNLSAIIGYQLTEPIASRYDFPTLFLIAAALETLVIFAAMFIDPDETRRTLGTSGPIPLDAEII